MYAISKNTYTITYTINYAIKIFNVLKNYQLVRIIFTEDYLFFYIFL